MASIREKNETLLNILNTCGLEQMIRRPTRIASNVSNILDLIITNVPQFVSNITTCVGISDHSAITFGLENIARRPKVKRNIKLFRRADFKDINNRLYLYFLDFRDAAMSRTVDENWALFKDHIRKVQKLVPTLTVNSNADPPWFNQNLKRLESKQRKLHQMAKWYGCDALLQKYKNARAIVKRTYKEAEISYKNRLGQLIKENSRHFWRYVKTKRGNRTGISSILCESGKIAHSAVDIANVLNNQYSKVFNRDTDSHMTLTSPRTSDVMSAVDISYQGIVGLLERIQVHKASGPDGISGAILKH